MVKLESVLAQQEQVDAIEPAIWHRDTADEVLLRGLIESHFQQTASKTAKQLLADWDLARSQFVKVFPHEYRRALGEMHAAKKIVTPSHSVEKVYG
jgi:glutamate synthase domain-containing protein 3